LFFAFDSAFDPFVFMSSFYQYVFSFLFATAFYMAVFVPSLSIRLYFAFVSAFDPAAFVFSLYLSACSFLSFLSFLNFAVENDVRSLAVAVTGRRTQVHINFKTKTLPQDCSLFKFPM